MVPKGERYFSVSFHVAWLCLHSLGITLLKDQHGKSFIEVLGIFGIFGIPSDHFAT